MPIKLTYNHRQGDERLLAEMFKRNARGIVTEEDLKMLESRVFSENDPRIPKDTLYVFPLKKMVKQYNEKQLSLLDGEYELLQATNILTSRQRFEPTVDEGDGKVRGTPLISNLYLKKNAKIILIYNVDVCDGLNTGAKGIVLDLVKKNNEVSHVIIQFENEDAGKALRQLSGNRNAHLNFHLNGTPLPKLSFSYNISRKQYQEGQKAICIQFPIQLGYAMTIHKIQGATNWEQ